MNKDSYVWDFATGSAGLLVAAMNEMLIDAKNKIKSPDELALKSAEIKANQLLGLEILSSVYMLAILNMILMGDGSSNILNKDDIVKFIDFSNDGYTRTNRRKSNNNLKDTDHAKERYQEVIDLVRFGKSKLNIFTEEEYYEGNIDPQNGADWNQSAPIDTKPTLEDFKKTVSDYLAWEVSNLLKNQNMEDDRLGK